MLYGGVFIPPELFWPAGIAVYGILPAIVINILLLVFLLIRMKKSFVWPFMGLLLGAFFIKISFHVDLNRERNPGMQYIDIMSLNAKNFLIEYNNRDYSLEMIDWVVNDSASIKCIQEFNTNKRLDEFDVTGLILSNGHEVSTFNPLVTNDGDHRGLAIFSRFPIINQGTLLFNKESANNCIYADIKVSNDTIRIYNVHLSSLHIPLSDYRDPENYDKKVKALVQKLRYGAIKHSVEIDILQKHTAGSPYPFIICGDFNDIPYSYNYMKLRKKFTNSFEKAGHGFGFSFNHKLFFLRIDHHFVSDGIIPVLYRVDRNMKKSDHFPTRGVYQIL